MLTHGRPSFSSSWARIDEIASRDTKITWRDKNPWAEGRTDMRMGAKHRGRDAPSTAEMRRERTTRIVSSSTTREETKSAGGSFMSHAKKSASKGTIFQANLG